jgi:hypothetical protein
MTRLVPSWSQSMLHFLSLILFIILAGSFPRLFELGSNCRWIHIEHDKVLRIRLLRSNTDT